MLGADREAMELLLCHGRVIECISALTIEEVNLIRTLASSFAFLLLEPDVAVETNLFRVWPTCVGCLS